MKTGHTHLFIPGPTNVPDEVRRAMNVRMEDMRAPDFGDLTLGLFSDLKRVMRTRRARSSSSPAPAPARGKRRSPTR
jgi:alanine-glyoxylate transaminase/serine-glyoxylate transaminase/serine-pyruvate transaminase